MFKKFLSAITLFMSLWVPAAAQQPQTHDIPPTEPPFATNSNWVNGVAPGYWPTALATTGLILNVGPGTSFFNTTIQFYNGTPNLTMANNTTNYVSINESTGIPGASTSNFASGQFPLAIVVTSGGNITTITDVRSMFDAGGNSVGSQLQMQPAPPISGQYVIIYPTACGFGGPSSTCGIFPNQAYGSIGATGDNSVEWSGFSLPSYVLQANITAVYAFSISESSTPPSGAELEYFGLDNPGGGVFPGSQFSLRPSLAPSWPTQTFTNLASIIPTNFPAITMRLEGCCTGTGGFTAFNVGLIVYYTGSAPPVNHNVTVEPPLSFNPATNTLSLSSGWPDEQFVDTVATLPGGALPLVSYVRDGATTTDCTTGGGTNRVLCYWDGSSYTGYAIAGGGGGGITQLTGDVTTPIGLGSVVSTLATVNSNIGTCGDASHVGRVTLNAKGLTTGCTPIAISAGTGLTSINGNNAAAQTFESTDSSVTITEPDNSHVNFQATGGSGSGVQYNPSTTNYIFASFSGLYDDNHSLSSAVPVTSFSSTGTVVTVETTSAHNLVAGDYVDAHILTGWPNATQEPLFGSFQVISTGLTSTQFEFNYTGAVSTCSSSCGSVYNADYWAIYQTANQPFIKGHGTVYGIESTIVGLDSSFSTLVAPLCALPGPNFLILEIGQNDLSTGTASGTMETAFSDVYTKAHAAGCLVIQGSIIAANYGGSPNGNIWANGLTINEWFPLQAKSFTNTASGAYWDQYVDYNAYLAWRGVHMGDDAGAGFLFAQRTNEAIVTKSGNAPGPFPGYFQVESGIGFDLSNGYGGTSGWYFYNTNGSSNPCSGNYAECTPWMSWTSAGANGGQIVLNNLGGSHAQVLQMYSTSPTDWYPMQWGYDATNTADSILTEFNYSGMGSASNYAAFSMAGLGSSLRIYGDGHLQFPFLSGSGTVPANLDPSGNLVRGSLLVYSVAGTPLPACSGSNAGEQHNVSDATLPTYLGTYAGSGGAFSPVVCNGTNWLTY